MGLFSNRPRVWDNVSAMARQSCGCAWKCRKCGRLHVQDSCLSLSETWSRMTEEDAERMILRQLQYTELRINRGSLYPLQLSGICEQCGHEQPWGSAVREKQVPTAYRRHMHMIAAVVAVCFALILIVCLVNAAQPGIIMALLGMSLLGFVAAVVLQGRHIHQMRRADALLLQVEETMRANGETQCFPVLYTGWEGAYFPEGHDERVEALKHGMAAAIKYHPQIETRGWDDPDDD